jgi:hypothetical protein
MDTGLPIRPTGSAAQVSYVRPEPAVRQAVPTDLGPAQSVTASAKASAARNESARSSQPATARDIVIDAASREVIFRVVDVRSGRVVRQVPDEALLRLKQYLRAEVSREEEAPSVERIV